jgi:glycosyltransferase involved in cell wall biosynthesis
MTKTVAVTHVVLAMDVGGLERNVLNQVREGCRLGQRVSVLCLERPGALARQVEELGGRLLCAEKRPGLRPETVVRVRAALRLLRPQVVHAHQITSLLYSGAAARSLGVSLVVHTEHGREPYARRLRTRLLGRLAGRFADRFYCLSQDMAKEILRHRIVQSRKIHVIGNGIDTARFRQQGDRVELRRQMMIPPDSPVIGTVGRLTTVKRQDLLLRTFARLRRHFPTAHLVLVGGGPLMDELRGLAAALGLSEHVHFLGYQAEPERFYPVLDAFALTSDSEGIPQALLEAAAAGVPAITSRVGGVPEVIDAGRTGLLFNAGDETGLLEGLRVLLADRALAARLAHAAREKVEESFDVRRMAEEYHRQFLDLLGSAGGSTRVRQPIRLVSPADREPGSIPV